MQYLTDRLFCVCCSNHERTFCIGFAKVTAGNIKHLIVNLILAVVKIKIPVAAVFNTLIYPLFSPLHRGGPVVSIAYQREVPVE